MNRVLRAVVADYYETYNNLVFTAMVNVNLSPVNRYTDIINRISVLLSADPLFKAIIITPKEVMDDLLDQETREWFVREACTRAGKFDTCSNRFYTNLATIAFAMDEQMKLISSEEFGGLFSNAEAIIKIDNPNGDAELYVVKDVIEEIVIIKPDTGMSVFELPSKLEYLMRGANSFARLHQKPLHQKPADIDDEEEEEEKEGIDAESAYMPAIDDFFKTKIKSTQLLFDGGLNEFHSRYYERKELMRILVKKAENLSNPININENNFPNIIEYFRAWNIGPEEIERTFNNTDWIEEITTEITAVDLFDTDVSMRWRVGGNLHHNMRKFLYSSEAVSENDPKVLDIIFPRWRDKIVVTVDNLILILNHPEDDTPNDIIGKIVFIDKEGNPYLRNMKGRFTKNRGHFELLLFGSIKFEGYGKTFIKRKIEQIVKQRR